MADDGPGIAEENLERIFDPFFSSKGRDKGTGLGLSLVQRTIADHGGSIEAHSHLGEGTAERLNLP